MNMRRLPDNVVRWAPLLIVALFAAVCLAGLWRVVAMIGLRVPFDPNEGWNAYHADAAMTGRALYPDMRAWFVNNYPPLSFYVVGALSRVLGDNIAAGRIVSLLSFLAVSGGIGQAARTMGCRNREALVAGLLFMTCLLAGSDYVGMDDPQLLGHALEMGALLFMLRGARADLLAALLFAVALFVKHNLIAMPLAAAAWLSLYDRQRALRFVAAGAAFAAAGLVAFRVAYGSNLFIHLASPRLYSLALLQAGMSSWLLWSTVPLAIAAALAVLYRDDKYVVFCAVYAATAVVCGAAFAGGAGVDTNVFFDADMALSLGVGLALHKFAARGAPWPAGIAAALLVPLLASLYLASDENWRDPDYWLHPMADEVAAARDDIAFLEGRRGPALCESLSLCYWAGRKAEVDVFNLGQEFATGARSDDELVHRIENRAFGAIEFDTLAPFSLTPRVRAALLRAYRIDHSDVEGVFLVPKTTPVPP